MIELFGIAFIVKLVDTAEITEEAICAQFPFNRAVVLALAAAQSLLMFICRLLFHW